MKYHVLLLACLCLLWVGCSNTQTRTYTRWTPVYIPMADFRASVKSEPARTLSNPGKIYVKGNYLFINEKEKGIHIIDNSNPSAPKNLAFINIPGNGDLAVKDNILYADSYIDFVALDISNVANITVMKRINAIFPNNLVQHGVKMDTTKGMAIDWKEETVTEEYDDSNPIMFDNWGGGRGVQFATDASSGGNTSSNGRGGSMARFTIYDKTLYAVSTSDMQIFAIDNPSNPLVWAKLNMGWDIETIFPYQDKLFIGSQSGMFIYDNKNQRNPVQLSRFNHARSCDPVVVQGDYAYVTLRAGSRCGGGQNQLDILDIKDVTKPVLLKSYAMQEPYGLGIDGPTLFICDGIAGLKVFNATDYKDLKVTSFLSTFRTYDIIPLGKNAIIVGPDGLYQYDYSNPSDMKLVSTIPIVK
jgi:hypothetical protein